MLGKMSDSSFVSCSSSSPRSSSSLEQVQEGLNKLVANMENTNKAKEASDMKDKVTTGMKAFKVMKGGFANCWAGHQEKNDHKMVAGTVAMATGAAGVIVLVAATGGTAAIAVPIILGLGETISSVILYFDDKEKVTPIERALASQRMSELNAKMDGEVEELTSIYYQLKGKIQLGYVDTYLQLLLTKVFKSLITILTEILGKNGDLKQAYEHVIPGLSRFAKLTGYMFVVLILLFERKLDLDPEEADLTGISMALENFQNSLGEKLSPLYYPRNTPEINSSAAFYGSFFSEDENTVPLSIGIDEFARALPNTKTFAGLPTKKNIAIICPHGMGWRKASALAGWCTCNQGPDYKYMFIDFNWTRGPLYCTLLKVGRFECFEDLPEYAKFSIIKESTETKPYHYTMHCVKENWGPDYPLTYRNMKFMDPLHEMATLESGCKNYHKEFCIIPAVPDSCETMEKGKKYYYIYHPQIKSFLYKAGNVSMDLIAEYKISGPLRRDAIGLKWSDTACPASMYFHFKGGEEEEDPEKEKNGEGEGSGGVGVGEGEGEGSGGEQKD